MRLFFFLIIISCSLLFSSCAAKKLNPAARKVRIVTKQPNEDKCEYLGEAMGEQGNWFTGKWTSNKNLEEGARNDMKNKAYQMGGNVLHLLNHAQGSKGSSYDGTGSSYKNDVQYMAAVYRCKRKKRRRKSASAGNEELLDSDIF